MVFSVIISGGYEVACKWQRKNKSHQKDKIKFQNKEQLFSPVLLKEDTNVSRLLF